jgi:hypothetical protein
MSTTTRGPDGPEEQADRIIKRAEHNTGVTLTPAARDMLTIPVVEVHESGLKIAESEYWNEVQSSVEDLLKAIANQKDKRQTHNSISVIRAFVERFCNIPPFCSRR